MDSTANISNQWSKLDDQVCFILYSTSRAIIRAFAPYLEKLGITYPQYLVIFTLNEFKQLTVNEIGNKLFLDSGTLTPLLKRMEKSGYIIRERSKKDERKVYISLTDDGFQIRKEVNDIPGLIAERSGLQLTELHRLKDEVKTVCDRLHQSETGKRYFCSVVD